MNHYLAEWVPYSEETPHIATRIATRDLEEIKCDVCGTERLTNRIGMVGRESRIAFVLIHKACGERK